MDGDDGGGCCFPEDIIFEILTRVPAKDLIRFKVVCKPWCFLISDRKFVKAHLHWASRAQLEVLLIPNCINMSHHCDYRSIKMHDLHFQTERLKSCPFQEDLEMGRAKLIDSCNGLLLFEKFLNKNKGVLQAPPDALILYNPVTRQCKNIPGLTTQGWTSSSKFLTALVHDDFIDKYRIYSILSYPPKQHTAYGHFLGFMYKVGDENINEDWETFEFEAITKPDSDSFQPLSTLLFTNNELYWVAFGDSNYDSGIKFDGECQLSFYLCSLNVAKQKFRMIEIIKIPKNFVYDTDIILSKVNGSLCMIIFYKNNPNCLLDIWVLEDEINGLWSAPYKINDIQSRLNNEPADFPLWFRGHHFVVVVSSKADSHYSESEFEGWLDLDLNKIFINREDQLFLYDLKKEAFKQIGSLGKKYYVYDSHKFHFDSLVTW